MTPNIAELLVEQAKEAERLRLENEQLKRELKRLRRETKRLRLKRKHRRAFHNLPMFSPQGPARQFATAGAAPFGVLVLYHSRQIKSSLYGTVTVQSVQTNSTATMQNAESKKT